MPEPRRFKNALGPRLAELRAERGLSQERLAFKLQDAGLKLDRTGVAKIETRLRSVFDFEVIVLAHVLGVPTDELLLSLRKVRPHLSRLRDKRKPRASRS